MTTVTASQAKTRFGQLLDRVAGGEEVIITRRGQPVARLTPEAAPPGNLAEVRRGVDELRKLQARIRKRMKRSMSLTRK